MEPNVSEQCHPRERRAKATFAEIRQRTPWWAASALAVILGLLGTGVTWIVKTVNAQEITAAVQKERVDNVIKNMADFHTDVNKKFEDVNRRFDVQDKKLESQDRKLDRIWDKLNK